LVQLALTLNQLAASHFACPSTKATFAPSLWRTPTSWRPTT